MYPAQANSPSTTTMGEISATDTSVTVADASILPSVPFLLTLGYDKSASETVIVTNKVGNVLTITRGADGSALLWVSGTKAARIFTAKDLNDIQANITSLNTDKEDAISGVDPKTTPIDADAVPVVDSADDSKTKKTTWANIKATLKTYFDSLYPAKVSGTTGNIVTFGSSGAIADSGTDPTDFAAATHASQHATAGGDAISPSSIGALGTSGNASSTTAAFTAAGTLANITTGETLATLFGKLAKWYTSFGNAAWKSTGTGSGDVATGDHTHSTYAPLASPTLTGTPAAPTATAGTNTTQLATTAFVSTAVSTALASAPLLQAATLSTSATLALSHANKCLWLTNSAAATITVPANDTVSFPTGTQIVITRASTGTVTLAAASGVTINSKDAKLSVDGQYAAVTLLKVDTNGWILWGALA